MYHYKRFNYEMIRTKYSILFYLKKSIKDPSTGSILARLSINRSKPIELCNTGIKCAVKDFDTKRQKTKNQTYNSILNQLTADIEYFIHNTPDPTPFKIRDLINGKTSLNPTMLKVLEMYMEQATKDYSHGTMKDWRVKIRKLEKYLTDNNMLNIEARRFTIQVFNQFKSWLINHQDNGVNHSNKYGLKLRKALRWATMQGLIIENPMRDCELPIKHEPNLIYLEWDIVEKLRKHPFESKLKKVVDMYVFSCCTGICYADLMNLKDSHIEPDEKGGYLITNKRQKVKSVYATPLWGFAKEIYEEFGGLDKIPKISNQRANDYIKIALHQIGYEKAEEITFHTGRKTFVNYCFNVKGLDAETIRAYTGHQSINELRMYGKLNRNVAISRFYEK